MQNNSDLLKFAKTLSGIYDNINQSQEHPKDFARINIYFRPLPWNVFDAPGFYSEQCYDYAPWDPYRQGIHKLTAKDDLFIVSNYGLSNSKRLAGAGRTPDLLKSLSKESLTERCGCAMHFKKKTTGHYLGMVEPGKKCLVPRDGKLTYLVSEVEVDQENWISRDRGYDPETDSQMWGSEHGLLKFKRVAFLSDVIADEWITRLS